MNNVLEVKQITKKYEKFMLEQVSFSLKPNSIMGFIGRNGAGKTTTIKSILNFIKTNSGEVLFFGKNFLDNEMLIKQQIGYATGTTSYYLRKRIREIVAIYKPFYNSWDNQLYEKYLLMFNLDENKKLSELSEGMKVKFNLLLALSHNAKVLILDEPTSGLDPISREELLEVFINLKNSGVSILFSTHIISDLEKCADEITYIKEGKIIYTGDIDIFQKSFYIINNIKEISSVSDYIGKRLDKAGYSILIKRDMAKKFLNYKLEEPSLDKIITHMEG